MNTSDHSILKRLSDIVISVVFLFLCWPVLLLLAVLVKLDSRGPVFFSQVRVGMNQRRGFDRMRRWSRKFRSPDRDERKAVRDRRSEGAFGKNFTILKFRTMRDDAGGSATPAWCQIDDPRITRVGRLLRRSHLDEIPQLLNVLMGDMSLVGPRPEQPQFVVQLSKRLAGYPERLVVKPGLTGLAQIRQRPDLGLGDVRKKIRYDRLYIRSWSWLTDLKILIGTVPKMFGAGPTRNSNPVRTKPQYSPTVSREIARGPLSLEVVFATAPANLRASDASSAALRCGSRD